jgi:hypothetical protein
MLRRSIVLPPEIDRDMFTLYRELRDGEFIIVFIDTAGEGSDFNAGQFLAKQSIDIPMVMHYKGSIVDVTPKLVTVLEWIADKTGVPPCIAYETNNGGGYELERLSRLNIKQKYVIYQQYRLNTEGKLVRTDKLGWNTNTATRPQMLKGVEDLVNNHLVTIYDPQTITEMFSFVRHKTPSGWKASSEVGTYDDLILSLAGVWQLYQTEEPSPPMDKLLRMMPKNDVPEYAQSFGVGTGNAIIQADSTNPFGRPVNPMFQQQMPEDNPFGNDGRLR